MSPADPPMSIPDNTRYNVNKRCGAISPLLNSSINALAIADGAGASRGEMNPLRDIASQRLRAPMASAAEMTGAGTRRVDSAELFMWEQAKLRRRRS